MIEQRPVAPMWVDTLKELTDLDFSTMYDIQKDYPDEIFIMINNIWYKNALNFKFVPFASLVNKFLWNWKIHKKKSKDELEINSKLNTLNSKINWMKWRQQKKIDYLENELLKLKKLLSDK